MTAVCLALVVAPPISSGTCSLAPHLRGDVDHLVQRRRNQTRQADHVRLRFAAVAGFLAGHHDAQVDDLVIVAAQDHADDVLADVVDVPLTVAMKFCPRLWTPPASSFPPP